MVTGAEIGFGLKALGGALGLTQQILKLSNDANTRAIVIEMQSKILEAQGAHLVHVDRIRDLETEIRDFKTWEAEKQRYELRSLGWAAFAYVLKPNERGSEPPHCVCANCYKKDAISILQYETRTGWYCPSCKAVFDLRDFMPNAWPG